MLKKDIDTGLFWFIELMVEQLKEFIEIEESRPIKAGPLDSLYNVHKNQQYTKEELLYCLSALGFGDYNKLAELSDEEIEYLVVMNSLMGYSLKDVTPPSALLKKAELLSANKKLFNNPQDDNKEIIDALMRKKNLTEKQAKLFAIEHDLI